MERVVTRQTLIFSKHEEHDSYICRSLWKEGWQVHSVVVVGYLKEGSGNSNEKKEGMYCS